jgi:septum formation topological specificity factor MinE
MVSLNRLFNHQPNSRTVAKNRLRQVLVNDRVNPSPVKMDRLKDFRLAESDSVQVTLAPTPNRQGAL